MNRWDPNKEFLMGAGALIGIVVFLGLIIAIQYIFAQHPKRWDWTRAGKYTLASQSKNVLKTFQQKKLPIKVTAFYSTSDMAPKDAARDLFDQYRDVYPELTYTFVDPDQQFALAKKYEIDTYPTTVIEAGKRKERIHKVNEESVTNALVKLMRNDVKKVYFLKGHGELSTDSTEGIGMSLAKEQIIKQNYKVGELVLLQASSIPDDATMLIIVGAKMDLMDRELDLVRSYLKRGGKLLVALKPFEAPKLRSFLKEYGFETKNDLVVDPMSRVLGGGNLIPVITKYVKFPITKNFTLASFFPEAESVNVTKSPKSNIKPEAIALTSPFCWTITREQLKAGKLNFDPKTGTKGEIPLMAVSTYTYAPEKTEKEFTDENQADQSSKPAESGSAKDKTKDKVKDEAKEKAKDKAKSKEEDTLKKARIVVVGSSMFAANKLFRLQGNGDLFMNTVSWLAEDENLISIRPKSSKVDTVVLSVRQIVLILLGTVVCIPLAWFAVGGLVFFYRKWKTAV